MRENFSIAALVVFTFCAGFMLRQNAGTILGEEFLISLGMIEKSAAVITTKKESWIQLNLDQKVNLSLNCRKGKLRTIVELTRSKDSSSCGLTPEVDRNCNGQDQCLIDGSTLRDCGDHHELSASIGCITDEMGEYKNAPLTVRVTSSISNQAILNPLPQLSSSPSQMPKPSLTPMAPLAAKVPPIFPAGSRVLKNNSILITPFSNFSISGGNLDHDLFDQYLTPELISRQNYLISDEGKLYLLKTAVNPLMVQYSCGFSAPAHLQTPQGVKISGHFIASGEKVEKVKIEWIKPMEAPKKINNTCSKKSEKHTYSFQSLPGYIVFGLGQIQYLTKEGHCTELYSEPLLQNLDYGPQGIKKLLGVLNLRDQVNSEQWLLFQKSGQESSGLLALPFNAGKPVDPSEVSEAFWDGC